MWVAAFHVFRVCLMYTTHVQVSRSDMKVTSEMADKSEKFVQNDEGGVMKVKVEEELVKSPALSSCLLYTSPSPRDATLSRMPSSA